MTTTATTSNHRYEFLSFAQRNGVLRFGQFTTKAGRASPYFFNAGLLNTGAKLADLGGFYADALTTAEAAGTLNIDMLYGPAYKGIPLACATAIALAQRGRDIPFAFNRKEAKDHGEGGTLIGSPLQGRVLIIDDVISAGTSVRESVQMIKAHGAEPAGVLIALDRMERGGDAINPTDTSAVEEVGRLYGIPVVAIANLDDLLGWLACGSAGAQEAAPHQQAVAAYRQKWGVQRA